MKVLIIVNRAKSEAGALITELESFCRARNIKTAVRFTDEDGQPVDFEDISLALTLGGDGTVLYAARHLPEGIPVLAVNLGTVGFITEFSRDNWKDALIRFCDEGSCICSRRLLLSVGLYRGQECHFYPALNDAVVCAENISKLISVDLEIDGSFVGRFRADGLLCSTPTGSTAYSAAAGGPILDPEMDALIISPVCPYSLSNRPLVIPAGKTVLLKPSPDNKIGLILTLDGQDVVRLQRNDFLEIKISGKKLLLIKAPGRHFYDVLRSKLNWSGGTHA